MLYRFYIATIFATTVFSALSMETQPSEPIDIPKKKLNNKNLKQKRSFSSDGIVKPRCLSNEKNKKKNERCESSSSGDSAGESGSSSSPRDLFVFDEDRKEKTGVSYKTKKITNQIKNDHHKKRIRIDQTQAVMTAISNCLTYGSLCKPQEGEKKLVYNLAGIEALLEAHPAFDVNAQSRGEKFSILHLLARVPIVCEEDKALLSMITMLKERGASLIMKNQFNQTPYDIAVILRKPEVIQKALCTTIPTVGQ